MEIRGVDVWTAPHFPEFDAVETWWNWLSDDSPDAERSDSRTNLNALNMTGSLFTERGSRDYLEEKGVEIVDMEVERGKNGVMKASRFDSAERVADAGSLDFL